MLWLTVVVGVSVSWWIDRDRLRQDAERNRAVVNRFKAVGFETEVFLEALEKAALAPPPVVRVLPVFPAKPPNFGSKPFPRSRPRANPGEI